MSPVWDSIICFDPNPEYSRLDQLDGLRQARADLVPAGARGLRAVEHDRPCTAPVGSSPGKARTRSADAGTEELREGGTVNRGVIGLIVGVLVIIILVLVIMRLA
ncbi:MAG TPA: hypothetical protein VFU98_10120 [Microlunatus sp.]|nr:hypothetical protein [Microlunatus sp.]